MARVVLDTDVASLSYKGRLPSWLAARMVGQEVCVTFVTIGESHAAHYLHPLSAGQAPAPARPR